MSDVFISYAREDHAAAGRLAEGLQRRGWSVWWDPLLRTGERYDDVIQSALETARCVVVLWSEHSVRSRYVLAEASFALERDVLVPVALAPAEPPLLFRRLHTTDLADWAGNDDAPAFRKLADDMAAAMAARDTDPASGARAAASARRPVTAATPKWSGWHSGVGWALAVVMATALAIGWWALRFTPDPHDPPTPPEDSVARPPRGGPGGATPPPDTQAVQPPLPAPPEPAAPVASGFRAITLTHWVYASDDGQLGYGNYPEHRGASSGSACASTFRVDAEPGRTYHNVPTTRVSGGGTGPAYVFVASPGGERASVRRTVRDPRGDGGWYADHPAFNGDFVPAGEWRMVISYPGTQAPADSAAGALGCARIGPITIRFNW